MELTRWQSSLSLQGHRVAEASGPFSQAAAAAAAALSDWLLSPNALDTELL